MRLTPVLVLFSLLSTPGAQDAGKKPDKPADGYGQAKEAGAHAEPGAQLKFPVTGLSKDNLAKVKESLGALSSQIYVCSMCKVQKAMAGKCTGCQGDLKPEKHALFTSVVPSPDDKTVQVTLDPAVSVRYSEIESALGKNAVKVDAAAFPISGKALLVLKGGSAESVATVEKALKDAKLFDELKVSFDVTKGEMNVMVHAGTLPPTRAKVTSALEAAGVKVMLSDVVFGPKLKV